MSYSQVGSFPQYTRDVYRVVDGTYRTVPLVNNNVVYSVDTLRAMDPARDRAGCSR